MEQVEFMRRRQKNSLFGKPSNKTPEPPRDTHTMSQCEDCGRWMKPNGIYSHKRWCKEKMGERQK